MKPVESLQAEQLDFVSLGIGGLDRQFEEIFRRAFSSRTVPPDLLERMGQRHVKGMLLYGPPGTGQPNPTAGQLACVCDCACTSRRSRPCLLPLGLGCRGEHLTGPVQMQSLHLLIPSEGGTSSQAWHAGAEQAAMTVQGGASVDPRREALHLASECSAASREHF